MELTVFIDGRSLRHVAPYGGVRFTTTHRGSGVASWQMSPEVHQRMVHLVGKRVVVKASGAPVFTGHLTEFGQGGECNAMGLPTLAEGEPAVDATGEPTVDEPTATAAALARGALDGWVEPGQMGAWTGDPAEGMTLAELYDAIHEPLGLRWMVTPTGHLRSYPIEPGEPDWHVMVPGYRYGYHTDSLVTHITGRYMVAAGVYLTTTYATGAPGVRRGGWVDITGEGILTEAMALDVLANLAVSQGVATPSPTERIEVGWGQLYTPGRRIQPPWRVAAGDTVRLWGASDGHTGKGFLDVRLEATEYDSKAGAAVLTPANMPPRGFAAALEQMFAAS